MRFKEFIRESMSDIDIELQDYKRMSPAQFINAYGMNKLQWYKKYQGVVGQVNQQHSHKAHSYAFHIPGEDPQLNQDLTRHFDTEEEAEAYRKQLEKQHPGVYGITKNKTN